MRAAADDDAERGTDTGTAVRRTVDQDFHSGDALFTFGEDLRVRSWNTAAEALTGIGSDEAVGRFCWEVFRGHDLRGSLVCHAGCASARLARAGTPTCAQQLIVKTATGPRVATVSIVVVRHGSERVFLHVVDAVPEEVAAPARAGTRRPTLTPRQLEVLRLLARGKRAKEVATELGITEATVRNHIRMALFELGCNSQLQAVAEGRRLGLV